MKNKFCCYKCQSTKNLLVEEKVEKETGKIIEKNFICANCSDVFANPKNIIIQDCCKETFKYALLEVKQSIKHFNIKTGEEVINWLEIAIKLIEENEKNAF